MPLRRHAESKDEKDIKKFQDAECQTTVSLPSRVSAMWQCHCPEANTVVDRVAQERGPNPRILLESFDGPSADSSEIDWGNKEAVDQLEREMREIREKEFLGEVSADDPRQDHATAPSPCYTPSSAPRDPVFDFDDLDKAESENSESEDEQAKLEGERFEAKHLCQTSVK